MATENNEKYLLELLRSRGGQSTADWPYRQLALIRHYGVCDEVCRFIEEHEDATAGEVNLYKVFAFREKPGRVVWTKDEFREKVRLGEVDRRDVIQMADGFVPPQY